MSLLSAISDSIDGLFRAAPGPPGMATLSGGWLGGPATTDAYGAKRAPSPSQLVESYKSLVYACVQINDNAVARVPLRLYADGGKAGGAPRSACDPRRVQRSEWQRLRTLPYLRSLIGGSDDTYEINVHPFLEMLERPDPDGYFDRQQILSLITRYVDVVGVAYNKPDGPAGLPPLWFWPLASQYVVVQPLGGSPLIGGYTYFGETYGFDELVRFRLTPSLKDPYKAGYCATYAALQYAGLEDEWVSIQQNTLSNGARPSMLVSAADATMPIQEQSARRLEQDLDRQHSRGMSGRPWVIRDAVNATPLNWPPGDLAGLEISKNARECVANCFGVPTEYLTGDRNLANLQAAREHHAANAVEPRCKMIAAGLTRLIQRYDPRLFFAFDSAVPEDEERRSKITASMLGCYVHTINEERAERNLPPVPYGDEPWMAGTLKQPAMLAEAHQQGIEAQRQTIENATKATEFQYSEDGDDDPDDTGDDDSRSFDDLSDDTFSSIHGEAIDRNGNPYHDPATGEFTSGPGGFGAKGKRKKRKHGPHATKKHNKPHLEMADAAHHVRNARQKGHDIRLTKGAPAGKGEAAMAAKAAASGRVAVRVQTEPRPIVTTSGDRITHTWDDDHPAHTYPHPDKPGKWVSEQHSKDYDPEKKTFASKAAALAASEKHAKTAFPGAEQHRRTKGVTGADAGEAVHAAIEDHKSWIGEVPADMFTTRLKVLHGASARSVDTRLDAVLTALEREIGL